jgi:hypothetical protein
MPAVIKNTLFRCAVGTLAAASLFYLGILGVLSTMQRFGCCLLVLNY